MNLAQKPGAKHASIEAALRSSGADGTRSILDMQAIGSIPKPGLLRPLPDSVLMDYCGTTKPSLEMILENDEFMEDVGRGQGVYIVTYKNETESQIYFGGYSYD